MHLARVPWRATHFATPCASLHNAQRSQGSSRDRTSQAVTCVSSWSLPAGFSSARKLQQLTCANAPRLLATKNACATIFSCASPKDSRLKSAQKLFDASCARCLKNLATSPCGKGTGSVPKECQQGLSVPAISSCLTAAAGH